MAGATVGFMAGATVGFMAGATVGFMAGATVGFCAKGNDFSANLDQPILKMNSNSCG